MDVFLSWSGEQSKAVANELSSWISQVIQAVDPWISSDIDKGARWSPEISSKLESSKVGIICLTRDNLNAPWILFEAGALSRTKDGYVCTFLLGLEPTDIRQPLGQFQHTIFEKTDIYLLISTINELVSKTGGKAVPEKNLTSTFEIFWPCLESALNKILNNKALPIHNERSEREILQEVLEILREQERRRMVSNALMGQYSTIAASHAQAIEELSRKNQGQITGLAALALSGLANSSESSNDNKDALKESKG